ncbi:PhzF family phenazine biosynthesis protein [Pseudohalocynthiibacter aestuariivivens]|uniref:PhzF family phenazine biosynthesis protein n=1 Tax=Pseudohalocynthiibacter aestuariivivens TaxID=1591409 RepID=A0ABV5JD22_9RHOB|nr:PhzF family phenazine biosynthesis protein [Pseudohalocynthiibacter aestuariivivens]
MPNILDFVFVDVFSDRLFGGNQLAVFPFAGGLPDQVMAAIACELKVNETVFITGKTRNGFTARIFSPHGELPFAGHPVVGAAFVLAEQCLSNSGRGAFELDVPAGSVAIEMTNRNRALHIMLQSPILPVKVDLDLELAQLGVMLGLVRDDLVNNGWLAEAYSAGVPFLCIPLASRAAVTKVRLKKDKWSKLLADSAAPHIYIFAIEEDGSVFARMFAPGVGIDEDPATGAAAVALGGYLASHDMTQTEQCNYTIHQGAEMGRPSVIALEVCVANSVLSSVRIGGHCTYLGRGTLSPNIVSTSAAEPSRRGLSPADATES